jgi:hypothetical protein
MAIPPNRRYSKRLQIFDYVHHAMVGVQTHHIDRKEQPDGMNALARNQPQAVI